MEPHYNGHRPILCTSYEHLFLRLSKGDRNGDLTSLVTVNLGSIVVIYFHIRKAENICKPVLLRSMVALPLVGLFYLCAPSL